MNEIDKEFDNSEFENRVRSRYRKLMGMEQNAKIVAEELDDWAVDTVAVKSNIDREKTIRILSKDTICTQAKNKQQEHKTNNNAAGAAGEYYVLAELLRRGYIASILYECAEDYDILAYHPDNKKHLKIQVKTGQQKSLSWTLGNSAPGYDQETYYVFVTLLDNESPQYYIVHSETVHYRAEKRHNTLTESGMPRTNRRKFILEKEEALRYKDNWNMLL